MIKLSSRVGNSKLRMESEERRASSLYTEKLPEASFTYRNFKRTCSGKARLATTQLKGAASVVCPCLMYTFMHNKVTMNLSKEAMQRFEWFLYYERHRNARAVCRHFDISPDTFYRWKRRYDPNNLYSLEDDKKNRRPKKLRSPVTPSWIVDKIKEIKKRHPGWGKNKIFDLMKKEGIKISVSTIGRTIKRLRVSGVLREPVPGLGIEGRGKAAFSDYKSPTGYTEYLSLLQLFNMQHVE